MNKGKIFTIGSNLNISSNEPLLIKFVESINKPDPTIGIVPSANANPSPSGKIYKDIFESLGIRTLLINPEDRDEANDERFASITEDVDAFFFIGGHQLRVTAMLSKTKLLENIHKKFNQGALLGGIGAGTVCFTSKMIAQDLIQHNFVKGEVELTDGLGFIDNAVIDTHFTIRGKLPILVHVISENPHLLGVGIGEETGIMWNFDKMEFEVYGRKNIIVLDGKDTDIEDTSKTGVGEPIRAANIKIHTLTVGCKYRFHDRQIIYP
ncbi:MAG: cyanophycinase [Thermoplasmata archaeon]